ncbi:PDZ domain-containing protein [Sarcoptes scabiei]|nr:PDZ domain-containing protein [Sarcoptes scabiei]
MWRFGPNLDVIKISLESKSSSLLNPNTIHRISMGAIGAFNDEVIVLISANYFYSSNEKYKLSSEFSSNHHNIINQILANIYNNNNNNNNSISLYLLSQRNVEQIKKNAKMLELANK